MTKIILQTTLKLLFPTHLAYHAAGAPEIDGNVVGAGRCALCGLETERLRKKNFSNSFTDWFMLKDPSHSNLCDACQFVIDNIDTFYYWNYIITPEKITFFYTPDKTERNAPFGESRAMTREEMQEFLRHPPSEPWILHLQPGGNRRHILPKMNVNLGEGEGYWIYHGDTGYWVRRQRIGELLNAFNEVRTHDLYWSMITGHPPKEEDKKAIWENIKDVLAEYRSEPYFLFLYNRFSINKEER